MTPSDSVPVVIVCSTRRAQSLHETLLSVIAQTAACKIIVSIVCDADIAVESKQLPGLTVISGTAGLCSQRNAALRAIEGRPEAIVFVDDDVELHPSYVHELLLSYRQNPQAAMIHGANLAHDKFGAGSLDRASAKKLIRESEAVLAGQSADPPGRITEMSTAYGCRMSIRGTLLGKLLFDENLVLYSFLEDLDFGLRCRRYGIIAECSQAISVHIEISSGRMGDKRRGYSDVVNPFYIWSKQTGMTFRRTFLGSVRRTLRNVASAITTRAWARVHGNFLGWFDVVRFRYTPNRILDL